MGSDARAAGVFHHGENRSRCRRRWPGSAKMCPGSECGLRICPIIVRSGLCSGTGCGLCVGGTEPTTEPAGGWDCSDRHRSAVVVDSSVDGAWPASLQTGLTTRLQEAGFSFDRWRERAAGGLRPGVPLGRGLRVRVRRGPASRRPALRPVGGRGDHQPRAAPWTIPGGCGQRRGSIPPSRGRCRG